MNSLKNLLGISLAVLIAPLFFVPTSCKNAATDNAATDNAATDKDKEVRSDLFSEPSVDSRIEVENYDHRTSRSGVFIEPASRESFDTIGFVCGNFGVSHNDTLYCIALGCSYYKDPEELDEYDTGYNIIDNYMFSSKSLYIPELYIKIPFLDNVQTMDLDCDGVDELVMINDGYESVWSSCMAYSLYHGKWNLIKPVVGINTVYRTEHPSDPPYVPACEEHPGYMYINEDKFLPEVDPTEVKTVRSLVKIEREPVDTTKTICYTLPGGVEVAYPF